MLRIGSPYTSVTDEKITVVIAVGREGKES